jgi:crotonobetainyl-CoA:carnitine CoA-transferase CaiB-like acyl-CoA transferase
MQAAIAILASLLGRGTTSTGAFLDVSAAEGVLSLMSLHIDRHLATGEKPGPGQDLLTGRYACYDVYRARDGKWLAVAAIEPAFYANLCKALGLEEWIPHQTDDERQDEIRKALREAFARRDRDDWVAELGPRDTCVAPICSIPELVEDDQFLSRRAFVEAKDEEHGTFRQVGPVLAGTDRTPSTYTVRDASVTDTAELLRGAGVTEEQIERMVASGVVA